MRGLLGALITASSVLWLASCLSVSALRVDCERDSDCAGTATCEFRVCVPEGSVLTTLQCPIGLTACDEECVDIRRDPRHCGGCFEPCLAGPQEQAVCAANVCERTCNPGFWDVDAEAPGCEYACERTSSSAEICDLRDNDCDGAVDGEDEDIVTRPCAISEGICAQAQQPCVDGEVLPCDDNAYAALPLFEPGFEVRCDTVDNNCDGVVDEHCCADPEAPGVRVRVGSNWSVVGFQGNGDALTLMLFDIAEGRFEFDAVGTFDGVATTADVDEVQCEGRLVVDASPLEDARAAMVCSNHGSTTLGVVSAGAFARLLGDEAHIYMTEFDAFAVPGGVFARIRGRDTNDGLHTWLAARVGDDARSLEFSVNEQLVASAAATPVGDEVLVGYVSTADEALAVRRFNPSMTQLGFDETVVALPGVTRDALLAGAPISPSMAMFSVARPDGEVDVVLWDHTRRLGQHVRTLQTAEPERLWMQAAPGQTALLGALGQNQFEVWQVSSEGEPLHHWSLALPSDSRTVGERSHAARVAMHAEHGILYLAYATPADVSGNAPGVFLHRLGRASAPLCH